MKHNRIKPSKTNEVPESRFIRTLRDFGEHTSFHGVKYIVSKDNSIYEKILWAIVVLLGIAGSVYMTMIFWHRFSSNPIRITIQSMHEQTSIIPFPGVTICTAVRQVPHKVEKLINNLVLPPNVTKEQVMEAMPMLMGYSQQIELNQHALDLLANVFQQNGYTATTVFSEIEPNCDEIVLKCRWENQVVPCKTIFKRSHSRDGYCCSFNLKVTKNFTSHRTLFYGFQMGLSLILNSMSANVSTKVSTLNSAGIKILIHSTDDYPGISSIEKILGDKTEAFIRILGTKLVSSSDVRSLSPKQRNCLFESERSLKYFAQYRDNNCGTECKMLKIQQYCDCIPFFFPSVDKAVCNISSITCLSNHFDILYRSGSKGTTTEKSLYNSLNSDCDCPPQCNDVFYNVLTSNTHLANVPNTASDFYKSEFVNDIKDKMVVHLFFGNHYQTIMVRDTITSTYYLLSSFGGVFSLFLGCSFLSILEIIYYFCIRFFKE